MSADGVPIEEIARLAGHYRTATTELVYRHELRAGSGAPRAGSGLEEAPPGAPAPSQPCRSR